MYHDGERGGAVMEGRRLETGNVATQQVVSAPWAHCDLCA